MSKIVLFFPNPFSATRNFGGVPLALLAIARIPAAEGHDIKIVTPHEHKDYESVIAKEINGALCLGITAMAGYQIHDGLKISALAKKLRPDMPIIWGGWHPSILPEETILDDRVDIVVRGQGEWTFAELVNALERKGSLSAIAGITYKKDGASISTPNRPPQNLDNLPPIPYHLIDVEKYLFPSELGSRTISYYTSYGCPHRCGFCVEKIVNKQRWVCESAEKTLSAFKLLHDKYGADSICVHDSNFFVNIERVKALCKGLIESKLDVNWGAANGRCDQLSKFTEDTYAMLENSRCKSILIGAESGLQETLNLMNKDITLDQTIKVSEMSAKHNIKIYFSFLVGVPWPLNSEEAKKKVDEEFDATVNFMDKILTICNKLRIMFFVYLPYPSSDLFDKAKDLGIELPRSLEAWSQYLMQAEDSRYIIQRQKWISKKHMLATHMISSYIFFFLDDDSIGFIKIRISNPAIRAIGILTFKLFRIICRARWKRKYFGFPLDFYFYNLMRKYLNIG